MRWLNCAFLIWQLIFVGCSASDNPIGSNNSSGVTSKPADSLWTRSGSDWPRMLGPNGNSSSTEVGIRTDWDVHPLRLVWTAPTGEGYGVGVAAKGRFLQFDRFGRHERLTCHHAETGAVLWTWEVAADYVDMYGYNSGPRASPLIHGDDVFVYGVTGRLVCLNLVDGSLRWQRQLNEEFGVVQNFFGVGSTPLAFGSTLLVMVGGSPKESHSLPKGQLQNVRSNGSGMVAFDIRDGRELYRTGDYLASYSAPIHHRLGEKDCCLALMREGLFAFEISSGTSQGFFPWRSKSLESVNAASPIIIQNQIWISETYEIGSNMLQWTEGKFESTFRDDPTPKNQLMRSHWSTPVLVGNHLYGSSGRNEPDADLRCVDVQNKIVTWTHRNRERSTLLAVDQHLLVLSEHGQLQLVKTNPEKFELVCEMDLEKIADKSDGFPLLEGPTWAPPVLSHGLLYLRGPRRIVCLEIIPPG